MEKLKQAVNLLTAVVSTMDTISVTGIDNQDKFVGCANAIRNAESQIRGFILEAPGAVDREPEVDNG